MVARLLGMMLFVSLGYAAIFIGPAFYLTGDPLWIRGWIVVLAMVVLQTGGGLWLAKVDPDLLKARSGMRPESGGDKFASAVLILSMVIWALMIPIDVFRLHLLPAPPSAVSLSCGAALFALGVFLNLWVLKVNSFGATTVKIQRERGQYVVDTGPYSVVRHPMYSSFMVILAGMALVMESVAMALAAVPLIVLGFLPRILVEEATLRDDLAGYRDYMQRVKSRVIPVIF